MLQRPDLSGTPAEVIAYIEALEAALARNEDAGRGLRTGHTHATGHNEDDARGARSEAPPEPSEPATTIQIISISVGGTAKRTPRHLYGRQRRGGMGVFDLDAPEGDPVAHLLMAEESVGLILMTSHGRVFRVPVRDIVLREVRGKGEALLARFPIRADEQLALAVPDAPLGGGSHLVLVSERGQVRRIARQYLGPSLQAGTVLYDVREGGPPAAACWSTGNDELFLVTGLAQAIRFAERLVPVRGCLGMRVEPSDRIVGVAAVPTDGAVFLLSQDGKGAIRELSGFAPNKAPGSGGKVAMKTDALVGAVAVNQESDLFVISQLGKIIRFEANEVPPKEGVVQGVNCMNLRNDFCAALTVGAVPLPETE